MSMSSYMLRARPTYTSGVISRTVSRNSLPKSSPRNTRLFTSNGPSTKGVSQSSPLAALEATRIGGMRITTPLHMRRSVLGLPSQQARFQSTDSSTKDASSTSSEPPSPAAETQELKSEDSIKRPETANAANASESKTNEANGTSSGSKEKSKGPAEKQKTELEKLKEEKDDLMSRLRYLQADLLNVQRIANTEKEKMRDFAITKFAVDLLQTVDTLEMALKSATTPLLAATTNSINSSTDAPSSTSPGTSSTPSSNSDIDSSTPTSASPTPAPSSTSSTSSTTTTTSISPDAALLQGVDLTHRVLLSTLASYNIKPFNPIGEPFDPNWHEALFKVPQAVAKLTPAMQGKDVKPGLIMDTFKVGYKIKDRCLRAAQVGVIDES